MKEIVLITYNNDSVNLLFLIEEKLEKYGIPHVFVHEDIDIEVLRMQDERECNCKKFNIETDSVDVSDIFNTFQDNETTLEALKRELKRGLGR